MSIVNKAIDPEETYNISPYYAGNEMVGIMVRECGEGFVISLEDIPDRTFDMANLKAERLENCTINREQWRTIWMNMERINKELEYARGDSIKSALYWTSEKVDGTDLVWCIDTSTGDFVTSKVNETRRSRTIVCVI